MITLRYAYDTGVSASEPSDTFCLRFLRIHKPPDNEIAAYKVYARKIYAWLNGALLRHQDMYLSALFYTDDLGVLTKYHVSRDNTEVTVSYTPEVFSNLPAGSLCYAVTGVLGLAKFNPEAELS